MAHRLCLRLDAELLSLRLVRCGRRLRGGVGSIGFRRALRVIPHLGAQFLQLGLSFVQSLINRLGQAVQIQRGGGQTLVHTGQTLAHQHDTCRNAAGVFRHAGLALLGLLLQFFFGTVGVQLGILQNFAGLQLGAAHSVGRGGLDGCIHLARGRQLLLQGLGLLLQVVAFQLPHVGGFLAFLLAVTVSIRLTLHFLQCLGQLALLGLGGVGALLGGSQPFLQGGRLRIGAAVRMTQGINAVLQSLQLLLIFQFLLLRLVGEGVHVSQDVIFVKAEQTGTETLFLNILRFRRHDFSHPLGAEFPLSDQERLFKMLSRSLK